MIAISKLISKIAQWIDTCLDSYTNDRKSCKILQPHFDGFYPANFLENSFFVVVDDIPKPNFPELRESGLGGFIGMDLDGITYKNTYFLKSKHVNNLALHFHELVHVFQWQYLGAEGFINRYIQEIQQYGYGDAPLEVMAYSLDAHFSSGGNRFDVTEYVKKP